MQLVQHRPRCVVQPACQAVIGGQSRCGAAGESQSAPVAANGPGAVAGRLQRPVGRIAAGQYRAVALVTCGVHLQTAVVSPRCQYFAVLAMKMNETVDIGCVILGCFPL